MTIKLHTKPLITLLKLQPQLETADERTLSLYLPVRAEGFDAAHYDLLLNHLAAEYKGRLDEKQAKVLQSELARLRTHLKLVRPAGGPGIAAFSNESLGLQSLIRLPESVPPRIEVGRPLLEPLELMLRRLFPGAGRYPFHLIDLGAIGLFCGYGVVLTRGVEKARSIRWILVVYFFACVIAFAVPSELGANVERLRYAAPPVALLLASLRSWRPIWLVLPALALTISWNVTPLARSLAGGERDVAAEPVVHDPRPSL